MNKVIEYIKKNYIIFTIIFAVIVIVLLSLLFVKILNKYNKNYLKLETNEVNVYQYTSDIKSSFVAQVNFTKEKIDSVKCKDCNISSDVPLYYAEENKLMTLKNMEVINYFGSGAYYTLDEYATLTYDDNAKYISTGNKKIQLSKFFLYDGLDTYVIPYDSTLTIDSKEYNLKGNSFLYVNNSNALFYDYGLDKAIFITDEITSASLAFDDIQIDLLKDALRRNNKVSRLLKNVNGFINLKEAQL